MPLAARDFCARFLRRLISARVFCGRIDVPSLDGTTLAIGGAMALSFFQMLPSGMRYHEQRLGPRQHAFENALQRFWVERREALVEHAQVEPLQERAADEQPASLSVGELPAALAHEL